MNSLRADLNALSGYVKTVNGKVARIMSLLSDVASGQNLSAPNNTGRGAVVGGGGGGGGGSFQCGNVAGSAAAPAEVVHGGRVGHGGWFDDGGKSDGGIHGGGQDEGVGGAPPGYFVGPRFPVGQQQQGSGHYPPPTQRPSSVQQYPVGPYQVGDQGHVA